MLVICGYIAECHRRKGLKYKLNLGCFPVRKSFCRRGQKSRASSSLVCQMGRYANQAVDFPAGLKAAFERHLYCGSGARDPVVSGPGGIQARSLLRVRRLYAPHFLESFSSWTFSMKSGKAMGVVPGISKGELHQFPVCLAF